MVEVLMDEQTISVELPEPLFQRLQRLAELTHRPVENLVIQAIDQNMPSLPDNLPVEIQQVLSALNGLSDDELWTLARQQVDPLDRERYVELLDKERSALLTPEAVGLVEELYHQFNVHMLRKAYASILLKWRGYALSSIIDPTAVN
jgi:hypothetical protein